MKRKKLILHIGFSKCGSTSLQHILRTNEQYLLSNMVRVLGLADIFSPEVHELGISKDISDVKLDTAIFEDDIYCYILSDEGLGGSEAIGFRDAELKAKLFLKIIPFVSIEIMCCVKPIPSWIFSMWSQKLIEGSSKTIDFYLPPRALDTYASYVEHLANHSKFCPSKAVVSWERVHETKVTVFTVAEFFNEFTGIRWILNQLNKEDLFSGLVFCSPHQNKALPDQLGLELYYINKYTNPIFGALNAAYTIDLLRAIFGKILSKSRVEVKTLPIEGLEKFFSREDYFFRSRGLELLPLDYKTRPEDVVKPRPHVVLILLLLFPLLTLVAVGKNRLVSR